MTAAEIVCPVCCASVPRRPGRGRPALYHDDCRRTARAEAEAERRAAIRAYEEEQERIILGRRPRGVLTVDDLAGEDVGVAVGLPDGAPAAILDPARGARRWQWEPETDLDKIADLLLSGEIDVEEAEARLM